MVQLMKNTMVSPESQLQQRGKMAPVKREMPEEPSLYNEQQFPLHKRSKQEDFGMASFPVSPAQFNPLDEPSPLGLRLRKTPSLLDLIQMRLAEGTSSSKIGSDSKKPNKTTAVSSATDKLKASNFPASLLKIGTWEYKSRYEGDLVAKCYFAKHKLVWEVLDGGLKNKIEIQWSDIMALKATYPDDGPGTLDVLLTRQPLFFRETNPQPRKHTLWQATTDFTGGQAGKHKRHYLQCPQGLLGKHFEKLIQCDPRLNFLSQQPEIELESPYFEVKSSVFDDVNVKESDLGREVSVRGMFDLGGSPSGGQSSSSRSELHEHGNRPAEAPSPSSVMDTSAIEEIRKAGTEGLRNGIDRWDQIKIPGIHPSMSMSDLVNHIENRITEQRTSGNNHPLSLEEKESLEILEDITRCLFNDSQFGTTSTSSDEKHIMSKVNSLCCLLQKDPTTFQDLEPKPENGNGKSVFEAKAVVVPLVEEDDDGKKDGGMSRKDSVGDLLLNLPRIASLPQFFYNL